MITGVAGNTPYNDINKRKKKTDTTQFEVTPKVGQKTFGVQITGGVRMRLVFRANRGSPLQA